MEECTGKTLIFIDFSNHGTHGKHESNSNLLAVFCLGFGY